MGIPRFYRWLRNRYPQIRMDFNDGSRQRPIIDHFYIDFNALIYQCLKESGCFLKNKIQPLSIDQIYERVINYLMDLIDAVDPGDLIFIAVDGVAPRAKINQSRDRRFKSKKDSASFSEFLEKLGVEDKENFKENSISPGTEFLVNLCDKLRMYVMSMMETEWRHLKVFFSDCLVPGEGEHKIMDFLRESQSLKLFHSETTYCIYSPDADVILLSLTLDQQNVCLIRQDSTRITFGYTANTMVRRREKPQFEFIMINIIREYLGKEFADLLGEIPNSSVQSIINDFILLMAFVGNDFLPVQFCFSLKQSHMQNLFASYKSYLRQNQVFINDKGVIDWVGIEKLLKIAKFFEADMVQQKIRNKRSRRNDIILEEEEDKEEDDEIEEFEVENNQIVKGKDKYYQSRFGITKDNPMYVDIIEKYIEGLEFYNQYYFKGLPSWEWFYPYHYTPLLTDVHEYILNVKVNVKLNQGKPYEPFFALIMMMPISSFHLLPKPIQNGVIRHEELREPVDYFPKTFKLDQFQQIKYNKRALIPFLKQEQIHEIYKSIGFNELTPKERQRNSRNNTVLFSIGENSKISGTQIIFKVKQVEESLRQIFKPKQKKYKRQRFPSLQIYGKCSVDQKGKLIINRKYQNQGVGAMVYFNHFLGYIDEVNECPEDLKAQIQTVYERNGISGKCDKYYLVKQAKLLKEVGRISYIKTKRQVMVPDFALFSVPKYEYIREIENIADGDLYSENDKVVILNDKHFGYIGHITQKKANTAIVQLTQSSHVMHEKLQENEYKFYTIETVANILGIQPKVLLVIIDELVVFGKSKKNQNQDLYPMNINMGLSIINTKELKLVPKYARCQMEYENTSNAVEIFDKVELCELAIPILEDYVNRMEFIIDYLDEKIRDKDYSFKRGISVKDLFPTQKNQNFRLYKEFLKIYEMRLEGIYCSIYSKTCGEILPIHALPRIKEPIEVPYYELISKKVSKISGPALRSEPEFHDVGDAVILLRTLEIGFVMTIDDNYLHILLPKSKQSKKVSFLQVYNRKWGHYLMKDIGEPWDMNVSYYSPQHYTKVRDIDK